MTKAVIGEKPARDPIAEPGMVLTIRYDDFGETETFLLGRRGAEDAEIKVYSMASLLGRAIAGARPGDQRIYSLPNETGRPVTLLEAVPYEMHLAKKLGRSLSTATQRQRPGATDHHEHTAAGKRNMRRRHHVTPRPAT